MRTTKTKPLSEDFRLKLHTYLRESGVKIRALSEIIEVPENLIYHISAGRCKRISTENEEKINNHISNFYK